MAMATVAIAGVLLLKAKPKHAPWRILSIDLSLGHG